MTSVAQRLRQKLLDLAIHGKLVPQNQKDEPAGELLERIRNEELGIRNCVGKSKTGLTGFTGLRGGKRNPVNLVNPVRKYPPIPEDEIPFDLPKGWVWCRLTDIAEIQLGKMLDAEKNKGKPFRYLANVSVRWGSFDVDNLKTTRFTDGEIEKFALKQGDLLMCEGGVPGRCAVWRECDSEIKYQKALHRIRPCEVLPDYLQMYFEAIYQRPFFTERFTGSTIHHLPREVLMSVPVPLPPLAEQKRIVEKLNAMLKEATRIAEGTERLAQLRKKAKAKILDLAIRGKLLKQEEFGMRNEELGIGSLVAGDVQTGLTGLTGLRGAERNPVNHVNPVKKYIPVTDDEKPFDLPKGWEWRRLGEVGEIITGATPSTKHPEYFNGEIPFVKPADIGESDYIVTTHDTLTLEGLKTVRSIPVGSICVCCIGSIGKAGIATKACCTNQQINSVISQAANNEYLYYAILSDYFQTRLKKFATAITIALVNKSSMSTIPIPLPPLAEQRRIVAKVKEMLAACDAFGGEG